MKKIGTLLAFIFLQQIVFARLPDLIPFRTGKLWGFSDSTKKIIIPCRFSSVSLFGCRDSTRGVFDNKRGWILRKGDFIEDPPNTTNPFHEYLFPNPGCPSVRNHDLQIPFKKDEIRSAPGPYIVSDSYSSLYGFINESGEFAIHPIFIYAGNFHEGLAGVVFKDRSSGYIDRDGKTVIKFKYNCTPGDFKDGRAIVETPAGSGVIDTKGNYIIPPYCGKIVDGGNFFMISTEYAYSIIMMDKNGKRMDPRYFSQVNGNSLSNGYWIFGTDSGYGFFDVNGIEVIPCNYFYAYPFRAEITPVQKVSRRWGFIDKAGKVVVPFIYTGVGYFDYSGMIAVCDLNSKWGFMDSAGKIVIPCKYTAPKNGGFYDNGLCMLTTEGYIDVHGTEYWEEINKGK